VLSFASLSIVTNVSKEQTKSIMTDFFAAFIEISRRTMRECRIVLKGLGVLHLFKNREIAITGFDDAYSDNALTAEELLRARNKERQDLSYIDSASAVLSRGGGHAYSVKASTIDAMSMMTPPTSNPSVASSVFSQMSKTSTRLATVVTNPQDIRLPKKDILWKRYKQKNEDAAKRHFDEISVKSFNKRHNSNSISAPKPDPIQVDG
jgi:hypothetical protein